MSLPYRCWAAIDLTALRHNLNVFRELVAPSCRVVGVVKADAYGHGAVGVAHCLRREAVEVFGVASLEEAAELRQAGLPGAIWHLGVLLPDEAAAAVELRVTPTSLTWPLLEALEAVAPEGYAVHLKLDTGMGRRGGDTAAVRALWEAIARRGLLRVGGLMTHFATADCDLDYAAAQLAEFQVACAELAVAGLHAPIVHLASGTAALALPGAQGDFIRPGLALYGLGGDPRVRPVLSLHSRICQVRDLPAGHEVGYAHGCRLTRPTRVGLVPIGYGDGWNWRLSAGAEAVVAGRRVPYLGRVNMDLIQLDLNSVPGADVGSLVTLIGRDGAAEVTAAEVAAWAGTSVYSVPTSLTRRVTRVFCEAGRAVAARGLDGATRAVDGSNG
ncbi:MAG: alanine racemase [Fimbriimonadaceae bacterium]|nr:alanine racemase [Fimbriimonadaceae bacterium]